MGLLLTEKLLLTFKATYKRNPFYKYVSDCISHQRTTISSIDTPFDFDPFFIFLFSLDFDLSCC